MAKINKGDYASCSIEFDGNTAKVTIQGSGKFEGLNVCNGTKTSAIAQENSCPIPYGDANTYITKLLSQEETLNNGLEQIIEEYDGRDYNAGIRYVGTANEVKNKVYFNCEPTDGTNAYGSDNYDYASSCEIWRIIGVFEVVDENGDNSKRVKIVNTESTVKASWDSSASNVNSGRGVNQWGESTYTNGTTYEGADLMQLLNGYYLGKENLTCTYCDGGDQLTCSQTYDTSEATLSSLNMKPLTSTALSIIDVAVWDTYAIMIEAPSLTYGSKKYLEEKGISAQYYSCVSASGCADGIVRTPSWTGLVGLPSATDVLYSNGWLNAKSIYRITPMYFEGKTWASAVCIGNGSTLLTNSKYNTAVRTNMKTWPSVYLSSNVQITDGNGADEPYILSN